MATAQLEPKRSSALPYTAGFAAYAAFLLFEKQLPLRADALYAIRIAVVVGVVLAFSRRVIDWKVTRFGQSILLGAAVFHVWITPDVLFAYRDHWLFRNWVVGAAFGSLEPEFTGNWLFLLTRTAGSMLVVPVIEELFWRAWLMRWIIRKNFEAVPLGAYTPLAFWTTAVLFASEHGPYWEVGLLAGIAYNWWMVRTKSLGDCILAHAVTNGLLAAYVIASRNWQYWL